MASRSTLRTALWTTLLVGATACGGAVKPSDPTSDDDGPSEPRGPSATPSVPDAPKEGACSDPVRDPGPTLARRLTRWEYVNTVRDVLGVDVSAEAAALPPELHGEGLANAAKTLRPTLERVTAYERLATQVLAKLPDFGAFVGRHTSCRNFGDTCEAELVSRLGKRLARRPLRPDEVTTFRRVFATTKDCGGSFDDGAKALLAALLQSPQFLYRTEVQRAAGSGPFRALDGHELAARLSYLVVGSAPDEALITAAERGDLASPDRRAEHARRLLGTRGAITAGLRFANDWLTLDELDVTIRDPARFPGWSEALRAEAKEEALRLVEDVLFAKRRPLTSLLTHEETSATPALAALYGLPSKGPGYARYDLGAVPERKGILTTAAALIRSAGNADASMVSRSLYVFRSIMCQTIGGPPPGTDTADPPALAASGSKRALAERRLADPVCGGCHKQFEPLAFGFEPYDGVGAYKRVDDKGHATRSDGTIPGDPPARYETLDQYMAELERHPAVAACMVKMPYQHALGRALEDLDDCTLEDLSRALARTDGSYGELVLALVRHPVFAFIRRE